jgi:tRNA modification GTPase
VTKTVDDVTDRLEAYPTTMLLRTDDTIVAIASAPGSALRGIVRVSGPQARLDATGWFTASEGASLSSLRQPTAVAGSATLNDRGDHLPGELYVWPGQRSYTRQPTLEFHTIGSPPLLDRLVQVICQHGARAAEPGEFTLRAFLAGRLDLTQAEAVLGVIDAGSENDLAVALRQLAGGLADPLSALRDDLLDALAHLEAGLDFAEEDIEFIGRDELLRQLTDACDAVAVMLEKMSGRTASGGEYRVVLYGLPNAGKSSLLNALAGAPQAIVSAIAGTTRDYVTAEIQCGEFRCQLIDTAGRAGDVSPPVLVRVASNIDSIAQATAEDQASHAHVRVLCIDSTRELQPWEQNELNRDDPQRIIVSTKCDEETSSGRVGLATSSLNGRGLDQLQQAIAARLQESTDLHGEVVAGTSARCRDSLQRALTALHAARDTAQQNLGEEFVAAEIRLALEELGRVAGVVYTDDILNRIFSRFCIGK